MQTLYLRAPSLAALTAGLPAACLCPETGAPLPGDAAGGWQLLLIPPGTIAAETRPPGPGEDLTGLDTRRRRIGGVWVDEVIESRRGDWHADLLLGPAAADLAAAVDPAIVIPPPVSPHHGFLVR